jgi:hypothetical protein
MKKSIIGAIVLLFIATSSIACRIDTLGRCSGQAYFKTANVPNSAIFEVRITGTDSVIFKYTTAATGNTDTAFNLILPAISSIQFRYRQLDSANFFEWRGNDQDSLISPISQLAGCLTMELQFTNFTARKSWNNVNISFTNQDESNVSRYEVLMSSNPNDSTKWVSTKTIIPDGSHTYSFSLPLSYKIAAGAGTVAFFLPFMIGFKKRKKYVNIIALLLFSGILFWSCKKESVSNQANYNSVKIAAVMKDGSIVSSNVLIIK